MGWYWYALIIGVVFPWLVSSRKLADAFYSGLGFGLATWFGVSVFTVPIAFAMMFLISPLTR